MMMSININNTLPNIGSGKMVFFLKPGFLQIALGLMLLVPVSCKKFIEIAPPITKLAGGTVFTSDATAIAAMLGIYNRMIGTYDVFATRITLVSGLSADELIDYSTDADQSQFYQNTIISNNYYILNFWKDLYEYIYSANAVLEGLENSQLISPAVKKQLEGEAKFMRGFCYFYLVNMFGDVPLILSTDHTVNAVASRTSGAQVYQQIITDITDAESLLAEDYGYSNGERIRPNKGAATAMMARVYLYTEDWTNAELHASAVIDNATLYSLVGDLNNVFLKNSTEAIWQLQPIVPTYNTFDGYLFILTEGPDYERTTSLSEEVTSDFETGDNRKNNWVGANTVETTTYYFPYKYKIRGVAANVPATEYLMVLRLAEQYLIRAEARAQLNNITGAQEDINAIRERAGGGSYPTPGTLPNTTANDQASLLVAVEKERRVELFSEWGHRWLDLKRWKKADAVLSTFKANWQATDTLYPIPQNEILTDPSLTQNPNY